MPTEISAQIIADSLNPATGCRVTTFRLVMPKWLLAQFNTHRMLSRNAASSRAIPVSKILRRVLVDPFIPVRFGRAKAGMQDAGPLTGWRAWAARRLWLGARYPAVLTAWVMARLGVHKQIANRILESWMWAEVVVTATEWENFYRLRVHKDAQPEFQLLASRMLAAHAASTPSPVVAGHWHLPFADPDLLREAWVKYGADGAEWLDRVKARCTARCARASYLNFYGRNDPEDDLRLYTDLAAATPRHLSPVEHCCEATVDAGFYGNLRGFRSLRKTMAGESGAGPGPFDPKVLAAELGVAHDAS